MHSFTLLKTFAFQLLMVISLHWFAFDFIGKSLKHIQSGFCVHPSGGLAQDGIALVLWPGCTGNNIALTFVNQGKWRNK
jgi:hypothetical protein